MPTDHTQLHEILERSSFSPTTKRKYASVINMWIAFAGTDPSEWTPKRAQAFYDDIRKRCLPSTANVYIASLRYVSKWYARFEQRPDFDFAVVQTGGESALRGNKKQRALTREEVEAILDTCESNPLSPIDRRDRTLFILGLETGMRKKSLAGMTIEGIGMTRDYPTATVPIKGRGGVQTYPVPLSDTAVKILSDWLAWLASQKIRTGSVFRKLTPHINKSAKRIYLVGSSLVGIHKVVSVRAALANIKHAHPHLLRHTFITWRTSDGLSPVEISTITGHQLANEPGIGMTKAMDTYLDRSYIASMQNTRNATPAWLADRVDRMLGR